MATYYLGLHPAASGPAVSTLSTAPEPTSRCLFFGRDDAVQTEDALYANLLAISIGTEILPKPLP